VVPLSKRFNKYFLTGLIVLVPLVMTLLVVQWIIRMMDGFILGLLPEFLHPKAFFGVNVPGFGVLGTMLLVLLMGMLTANIFGRALIGYSERLLSHIPVINGVYKLFKQMTDTLFSQEKSGFRKVVLIEYPRKGIWTLAFMTGATRGELQRVTEQSLVNVFVPTTPNPTSGFFLMLPVADVFELKMSVDDAFKLIVSGGMVTPPDQVASLGDEDGI
jgi:uncharacterized membrane protein